MLQSRNPFLRFIGQRAFRRWLGVMLRTLHLLGVCGLAGGFLFQVDSTVWLPYLQLTLISGISLMLTEVWEDPAFLFEVRGAVIGLKFALLGVMALLPAYGTPLFITVIVVSGLASHAPKNFRHLSIVKHARTSRRGTRGTTKSVSR